MSKRFIIGIVSAVLLGVALTGCNTVRGAGADVESIGAAVAGTGGD